MRWTELREEPCPVARGLSVIGDRWTVLVLRDLFLGQRRFEPIRERLGCARHILSDRLKRLEAAGVVERRPYRERPLRHEYRLTEAGRALHDVLVTLIVWAERHAPGERSSIALVDRETGAPVDPVLIDRRTGREITVRSIRAEPQAASDLLPRPLPSQAASNS